MERPLAQAETVTDSSNVVDRELGTNRKRKQASRREEELIDGQDGDMVKS